jgi:ankyrin repeat protein
MPLKVPTRGGFSSTTDFFPLHYACERRPPVEVVQKLLKVYSEAATKRAMPGGALPLHIASTWYAQDACIVTLLQADRNSCKTMDELGNLPLHSACFSGTSTVVLENLLRAYPKAVLARNNQGSLPEDIAKRLKHDNRMSSLALLNLCRDEVIAKRQQKHQRGKSDGYMLSAKEAMVLDERDSHVNPEKYEIENCGPADTGIEVTYSCGSTNEEDLMWV